MYVRRYPPPSSAGITRLNDTLFIKGPPPVFITGKEKWFGPILKDARIALENGEVSQSTMLARRLVVFHFAEKLPIPKGLQIPDCGKCFSQMCQHYAALGQQGM